MNKIYLIGNGFDLAHGLKTRYSDFLLWYINKTIKNFRKSNFNPVEDRLTKLESPYHLKDFDSIKSFKVAIAKNEVTFNCKNDFFSTILNNSTDSKWVDIEYEYFWKLLDLYKHIEKHKMIRDAHIENLARDINDCLDYIKEELVEYLCSLEPIDINVEILQRFTKELEKKPYGEILFLVFNYTSTIEDYVKSLKINNATTIYIHGKLADIDNPIIFGYGDEMTEYYSKIEDLNNNEFLRHLKSFSYLKTNNYQNFNKFINKDPYSVSIMGHSCGLSDRVLLNSLFCNLNCERIRIYYYKKSISDNDFYEKTQEISRHFPHQEKNKMRNMILPFPSSCSLA